MNEVDDLKVVCLLFLFHFLLSLFNFNFNCLNIKCRYCNRGNRQCHNTMNLHWLVLDTYFGPFIQRDSSDRVDDSQYYGIFYLMWCLRERKGGIATESKSG